MASRTSKTLGFLNVHVALPTLLFPQNIRILTDVGGHDVNLAIGVPMLLGQLVQALRERYHVGGRQAKRCRCVREAHLEEGTLAARAMFWWSSCQPIGWDVFLLNDGDVETGLGALDADRYRFVAGLGTRLRAVRVAGCGGLRALHFAVIQGQLMLLMTSSPVIQILLEIMN